MFNQTPQNRLSGSDWILRANLNHDQESNGMGGVRRLLADVSELVALQGRLLAGELRNSLTTVIWPVVLLVFSAVILLGTIPVVLLAIANLLVLQWQWSQYAAQFAAGGVALVIGFVLLAWSIGSFKKCAKPLQQSIAELEKNISTLHEMLDSKTDSSLPNHPR